MNKIKFVRNPRISQVIIKNQKGQQLDERGIYAIGSNQLKGLIKVNVEQKGNNFKLIYNTTGFVPLKDHLRNTINKDQFVKLLQSVLQDLQSVQDANFQSNCILFDINYVMVNPTSQNIFFIYAPIQNCEGFGTLRDFLLSIVQNAAFTQGEDPTYIRDYVSQLNKNQNYSLFDLRDYLNIISPPKTAASTRSNRVRCPNCGKPITGNIKFCASCGTNVTGLTGDFRGSQAFAPPASQGVPKTSSSPRRMSQPIDLMGIPTFPPQRKKNDNVRNNSFEQAPANNIGAQYQNQHQYQQNAYAQSQEQQYQQNAYAQSQEQQYQQNAYAQSQEQQYQQNAYAQSQEQQYQQNAYAQSQEQQYQQNAYAQSQEQQYQQNAYAQNYEKSDNHTIYAYGEDQIAAYSAMDQQAHQNQYAAAKKDTPLGLEYNMEEPPKSMVFANLEKQQQMQVQQQEPEYADDDPYYGGTVVLTDDEPKALEAYLVRTSNGEKTLIDKPQFVVGRMLGHVDYCVKNNSAIGRHHAKISIINNRYYITDLNSTNGTYVDGRDIPKNVETEIFAGTQIRLANEDFQFVIE